MAKLILTDSDAGTQFQLNAGPTWDVTGTNGADDIRILSGANVSLNLLGGNDNITLPDNYADYTVSVNGTTVTLTDSGNNTITIPASTTANTLTFGNGETRDLVINIDQGAIFIGDDNISGGGGGGNEPTETTISAEGTTSATAGDDTFNFQAGTYEHTISGFAEGDVLAFPSNSQAATVTNESGTDGELSIRVTSDTNVMVVTLTGLATGDDGSIFNASSFTSVFGDASLVFTG